MPSVEWLAFLLCIPEVLGSNLSPEAGHPERGFLWFSSVQPGKCSYLIIQCCMIFIAETENHDL
jgi:hypothetical protein